MLSSRLCSICWVLEDLALLRALWIVKSYIKSIKSPAALVLRESACSFKLEALTLSCVKAEYVVWIYVENAKYAHLHECKTELISLGLTAIFTSALFCAFDVTERQLHCFSTSCDNPLTFCSFHPQPLQNRTKAHQLWLRNAGSMVIFSIWTLSTSIPKQ